MDRSDKAPGWVAEMLERQRGVLTTACAVGWVGWPGLRWRIETGRWQRPCRGVVVTHSGPVSGDQMLWVVVLGAGRAATLAGLTAARMGGLRGFEDERIHLVVPGSRQVRASLPGVALVHRSASFVLADVHPARQPPRTRMPRSIVDAASWMRTDNLARAVLAAGVQQRLVLPEALSAAMAHRKRSPRQALITATLGDIAGGAQALSELDFCDLTRRYRLPEPSRQALRRDEAGRVRWLDAFWERARVATEVDGLWHMDAAAWWADMRRGNELTASGLRVLRFPAFAVRDQPEVVAAQIAAALRLGGLAC